MSVIIPNTDVKILKTNMDSTNKHKLLFATDTIQYNYFNSLQKREFSSFTYQRESSRMSLPIGYDEAINYNYCMYKNSSYSNKWIYAFITGVYYVNDNMTDIEIKTDSFQTWQNSLTYKPCFIEREHISKNEDIIGANTIPENLEHGEYIIQVAGECETDLDDCYIIIGTTYLPSNTPGTWGAQNYGGVFSGLNYCIFDSITSAHKFILAMDKLAKASAITTMFMAPKKFCLPVSWATGDLGEQTDIKIGILGNTTGAIIIRDDITLSSPSTLNGYSPRNNKLYVYPYNVLSITNNNGANAEYHYEDFVNNTPVFSLAGVITPGISMKLFPNNYKKFNNTPSIRGGYNFGLIGGKYPECSWQSDPYTNWLTEQAVNQPTQYLTTGIGILSDVARGDVLGGVNDTLRIGGILSERYQHALQPPQAHGTNSGDVNFAMSQAGFTYYKMTIKEEYARIIDDYFDLYGYQTNRVKIPNLSNRSNWNYIKTINSNITGDIPSFCLEEINNMFDSGVTLWHTTSYFRDYSKNNN